MNYTFLHLSDLHYRPDWHEESELVCRKFGEDLKRQAAQYENPFLVFSGDLVQAAAEPTFYPAFHARMASLLDEAGFPQERRICIPGNHDVSRDALKPALTIQKGTLAEIREERLFNNSLEQLSKLIFAAKFENFVKYESQFAHYTSCASGLGGCGWALSETVGIYCLNTALCSFAGLEDASTGKPISDKERLMLDTRSLHHWLTNHQFATRILVMHHPLDWLVEWSRIELENIIANSFQLVFSGHIHKGASTFTSRGVGGAVHCVAPALFTRKEDILGYAFIRLDTGSGTVSADYRQWTSSHKFVTGTSLAGNDTGTVTFGPRSQEFITVDVLPPIQPGRDTLQILQAEFDEATTSYSSKNRVWVDRDLADLPETAQNRDGAVFTTQREFIQSIQPCVIRAPKQFGLTSLGRFIALEHFKPNPKGGVIAMVDTLEMPHHKRGVIEHIEARCAELDVTRKSLAGIILDNWHGDKHGRRILDELSAEFKNVPVVMLQSVDDCNEIADAIEFGHAANIQTRYLWALTKARIRELVVAYIEGLDALDEDLVTKRITEDIDALNIHRTPLNCLFLLKLAEQAFDDSPVNRTEVIHRVLYLLFYQFDKIPRYATRPDLKDCEYALGYFCEGLLRNGTSTFSKNAFYSKVQEYCKAQLLDLDIEVLFSFLATENILVRKGLEFGFRFTYWLHFFAAHRMHHDSGFAEFILGEGRYAAYPEIVEFYAGIDRRRSDAVTRLTEDLRRMNSEFLDRTGIPEDFNPFRNQLWEPKPDELERLKQDVTKSMAESALPSIVKDSVADKNYDRAKPYNQALAQFIKESSLRQLMQAMRGAARVLRNSDHVLPSEKNDLLEEVIRCWTRVCQILVIISPVLAAHRTAVFEDICFVLAKGFDQETPRERWQSIMTAIVGNVVSWFQEDIFSKKMGALLSNYVGTHEDGLGELLVLLVMIAQRPPGWEKEVESFIVGEKKNSFYLNRVFSALRREFEISFSTEKTRQELRRLAAMSLAKHHTGAKHPNLSLVAKAAKALDESAAKEKSASGE